MLKLENICEERKTTIIYTSHYMEEIEELCKRVFIMDLGQEVAYGTQEEVKSSVFKNHKVIINLSRKNAEAIFELKSSKGVIDIKEDEKNIILNIGDGFKLGDTLNILEKYDCIINKINYEEPRLEDVFLALTGKTLRD